MTLLTDTLVCDTLRLARWQNDPAYDYNRELMTPDSNFMDWIRYWLGQFLISIFGNEIADKYSELIFFLIFIVIVLLIAWFVYKKRPELFIRNKKDVTPYSIHEDNIYGVDFDAEIKQVLSKQDYKSAVRLLYLQTLKHLSDKQLIDWQLYKTPTQYIYEVKPEAIRLHFRELTNRFLRVRYGNYEADNSMFDEMLALQKAVMQEGGET